MENPPCFMGIVPGVGLQALHGADSCGRNAWPAAWAGEPWKTGGNHGEPCTEERDWGLNMEDTPKLHKITSTWLSITEKMLEKQFPIIFWVFHCP